MRRNSKQLTPATVLTGPGGSNTNLDQMQQQFSTTTISGNNITVNNAQQLSTFSHQQQFNLTMVKTVDDPSQLSPMDPSMDPNLEGGLKRSSSWRRFKESVTSTVKKAVGKEPPKSPGPQNYPSAVNPSVDDKKKTIDAKGLLYNTNCYGGIPTGLASPTSSAPFNFPSSSSQQPQPQQLSKTPPSNEVPMIVVTPEGQNQTPIPPSRRTQPTKVVRRTSSGRDSYSSSPVGSLPNPPVVVGSLPNQQQPMMPPPPSIVVNQQPMLSNNNNPSQQMVTVIHDPVSQMQDERKKAAIAKIKAAIATAKANPESTNFQNDMANLLPVYDSPTSRNRRLSDSAALMDAWNEQNQGNGGGNHVRFNTQALPPRNSVGGEELPGARNSATPGSKLVSQPSKQAMLTARRKSTGEALPKSNLNRSGSGAGTNLNRSGSIKKKPMIWEHFEPINKDSSAGRCKVCQMNVSAKYNTGNFVRHLSLVHKDVYKNYQHRMETNWTKSMLERSLDKGKPYGAK